MVHRLQATEGLKTDTREVKVQTKENKKDLTSPIPLKVRDDLPRVISSSSPAMVYPVTITKSQQINI